MTGSGRGPSAGSTDCGPVKAQEHFGEAVDCVDNRRAMISLVGEQRFLGVYTKKILVLDREYGSDNLKLAQADGITVIELPSAQTGALSPEDEQLLLASMRKQLGA